MLVGIRVKTELYWNNLGEDKWIWEWVKNIEFWTESNRGPIGGVPIMWSCPSSIISDYNVCLLIYEFGSLLRDELVSRAEPSPRAARELVFFI